MIYKNVNTRDCVVNYVANLVFNPKIVNYSRKKNLSKIACIVHKYKFSLHIEEFFCSNLFCIWKKLSVGTEDLLLCFIFFSLCVHKLSHFYQGAFVSWNTTLSYPHSISKYLVFYIFSANIIIVIGSLRPQLPRSHTVFMHNQKVMTLIFFWIWR